LAYRLVHRRLEQLPVIVIDVAGLAGHYQLFKAGDQIRSPRLSIRRRVLAMHDERRRCQEKAYEGG
jgi:hypothetical protein